MTSEDWNTESVPDVPKNGHSHCRIVESVLWDLPEGESAGLKPPLQSKVLYWHRAMPLLVSLQGGQQGGFGKCDERTVSCTVFTIDLQDPAILP